MFDNANRGPIAAIPALLAAVLALALSPTLAVAQDYPNRAIRVVIPFAAGSGADIICRYFTTKLQDLAGQPVVPDNRPGGIGNLAPGLVKSAKPDGYTLLFAPNSNMAFARYLSKSPPFDTVKDFVPVHGLVQNAFFLTVGPGSPARTPKELAEILKSKPQNRYGTTSPAAVLATESYRYLGGFEAARVVYRTAPEATPDLANGTLDFMIMDGTSAVAAIRQGKARGLAVTSADRVPELPDIPTMQEAGYDGFEFAPWWGAYAPIATPAAIVDTLAGWLHRITAAEDAKAASARFTGSPIVHDGKWMALRLVADQKWIEPVVKAGRIEPQD